MHEVYSAAVDSIYVTVRGYLCVSMHKFCFNSQCIQQILSVRMLDKHKHAQLVVLALHVCSHVLLPDATAESVQDS